MDKIERKIDVSCPIHFHLFHQYHMGKDPGGQAVADPSTGGGGVAWRPSFYDLFFPMTGRGHAPGSATEVTFCYILDRHHFHLHRENIK